MTTARFHLYHDDCLSALDFLPSDSIDAIVTDPPYGLSFMGKKWDYDVPSEDIWRECLRVLKPGGHLLAFAGARTQHRMAVRIEDAGFEIRDMIAWVYGSGFPKSHNGPWGGTALKPALEPITVARKPLAGTVAENVLAHGTGALNIDGCRVGSEGGTTKANIRKGEPNGERAGMSMGENISFRCDIARLDAGRWPANLIHDGSEEPVALLGDAARFFYCAKASKRDRDEGLDSFHTQITDVHAKHYSRRMDEGVRADGKPPAMGKNTHPTVKPTDLMRYLCRLVTPPGGVVLDPFTGSGSTGKAAMLEGFRFIGIEREAEYVEIARARIQAAL